VDTNFRDKKFTLNVEKEISRNFVPSISITKCLRNFADVSYRKTSAQFQNSDNAPTCPSSIQPNLTFGRFVRLASYGENGALAKLTGIVSRDVVSTKTIDL
jgi:hypothetical protein